jgi:hypothetical protein
MAEPRQLRPLIRQQFPGRAPGADYVTEGCPKHVSNFDTSGGGGSLSLLRVVFGFDPRLTPPTSTINSSLCHQSDEVF